MSEPTLREAYEALVLEAAAQRNSHQILLDQVCQVIATLMGRDKTHTFTPEQWEKAAGKIVRITPLSDGSIQLTVEVPK